MDNNDFKSLQIIYFALLIGQLSICGILSFLTGLKGQYDPEGIFWIVGIVFSIGTIVGSFFIYNKRKAENGTLEGLEAKLGHYRSSVVTRLALIEGGNLILVVFLFLEGGAKFYLIFFAIGIAVYLYSRPTPEEFINDYKLSSKEEEDFRYTLS